MQSVWVQVARWFWHLGINFHQLEIFAISHIGDLCNRTACKFGGAPASPTPENRRQVHLKSTQRRWLSFSEISFQQKFLNIKSVQWLKEKDKAPSPPKKNRKVVMSSRWIEYLETSCNFSPASSRTHLYYCIIEWTLCSIMKVCHIVVPTKLIFSEPNHSLPVDQIVTTLHPKCHIWGEHSLNSSSSWWLIDWARAGKPKFLLLIRDFVQKAGATGVYKYK